MTSQPNKNCEAETKNESLPEPLESAIEKHLEGFIPQGDRAEVARRLSVTLQHSEAFSGPIAHPRHLEEYERICPGAADRIIAMAERNAEHRMEIQTKLVDSEIMDQRRGMYLGAISFMVLVVSALASAVITSNPVIVGLFLGSAALGAIGLLIRGRNGGD